MASKNSIRVSLPNSYYHVYNRGVEKRTIFRDPQDFRVFLSYIESYVLPQDRDRLQSILLSPHVDAQEKDRARKILRIKNYADDIQIIAFALLPNHFHLLIRQLEPQLDKFMNSLCTRYGMYFNRRHDRIGVLFQDVYKAVMIHTDEQLLHVSRYIHQNPTKWLGLPHTSWQQTQLPSSLKDYLSTPKRLWVQPEPVLDFFAKSNNTSTYASFVFQEEIDDSVDSLLLDA